MITARAQYDERPALVSDLSFEGDKGLTKQSDLKDADINSLFARFEKTGQLPTMIKTNGHYGDFSAVPDYENAVQIVKHAEEQFAALDVTVRNRFENDPAKFLGFVTDHNNLDEIEKMGLLKPEAVAARQDAAKAKWAAANLAEKAKKAEERAALIAEIKAEMAK